MSEDVLIDGTTGEVIGPVPRKAKQAKPTFTGATTSVQPPVIHTTVIRKYRGFLAPITNRNPPPGPSAEQFMRSVLKASEKALRVANREVTKRNPLLGIIGDVMLDALKAKGRRPPR